MMSWPVVANTCIPGQPQSWEKQGPAWESYLDLKPARSWTQLGCLQCGGEASRSSPPPAPIRRPFGGQPPRTAVGCSILRRCIGTPLQSQGLGEGSQPFPLNKTTPRAQRVKTRGADAAFSIQGLSWEVTSVVGGMSTLPFFRDPGTLRPRMNGAAVHPGS